MVKLKDEVKKGKESRGPSGKCEKAGLDGAKADFSERLAGEKDPAPRKSEALKEERHRELFQKIGEKERRPTSPRAL